MVEPSNVNCPDAVVEEQFDGLSTASELADHVQDGFRIRPVALRKHFVAAFRTLR